MRPTFSIIAFTVLSGAGYGLLFLCGLALAVGLPLAPYEVAFIDDFHFGRAHAPAAVVDPGVAFGAMLAAGIALATIGLLSSLGHLGKPLRAWRAISQWRSSWLSREGVFALATYAPLAMILWLVHSHGQAGASLRVAGLALALCSFATVYCTAHIYSSLKPVGAWHQAYVVPSYLLLGLHAGMMWATAIGLLPSLAGLHSSIQWLWLANAIVIGPACAVLKRAYWRRIDAMPTLSPNQATGLGMLGTVHAFEAPHTEQNYLTHEMGFVLARKHARRLRSITFWLLLLGPVATLPAAWLIGWPAAWIALACGMLALFVERWLFFAEAKHAVMAYYAR